MIVLQIIIGVIAAVGVGFLLADMMKIPSLKASKAANSVGRKGQEKDGRHRTLPAGLCYQAGREAASERVQTRKSCD